MEDEKINEILLKAFSNIFFEHDFEEWKELNPTVYNRVCLAIELYNKELLDINKELANKYIKLNRSIRDHSKEYYNQVFNEAIDAAINCYLDNVNGNAYSELLKLKR